MSSVVIVAIPDENDRVWKVSSEKVPHLTLLFLGEESTVKNLDQIVQFVDHAANTTLRRFYLPVDRRDELGSDKADVLFFKTRRYDGKAVRDFRSMLLRDNNIKTAHDSAEQFEGPWKPHLTLGYPETPAKPDDTDRDFGFYDVAFTKIAVWVGDYDGPEFLLKDWDDEEDLHGSVYDAPLAAWSGIAQRGQEVVAQLFDRDETDEAEHSGVKGMKWGVRKDSAPSNQAAKVAVLGPMAVLSPALRNNVSSATATHIGLFGQYALLLPRVRDDLAQASDKVGVQKADKAWEKGLKDGSAFVAVNNAYADHFNAGLGKVNGKHPDDFTQDTKDFDNPVSWGPKYKAYMKDVDALTKQSLEKVGETLDLKNASGTKQVKVIQKGTVGGFHLEVEHVRHAADTSAMSIRVVYKRDANGRVTGFDIEDANSDSTVAHGAIFVEGLMENDEALAHYGVKGMHWGIRKASPEPVAPTASSRVPHGDTRKTKIDVAGGQNHPASDDAIKVAQARAKLAKSGSAALSNKELRDVATRIQLEQQVMQLHRPAAQRFVRDFLTGQGKQGLSTAVGSRVQKKVRVA